jgi:hypothetical protein
MSSPMNQNEKKEELKQTLISHSIAIGCKSRPILSCKHETKQKGCGNIGFCLKTAIMIRN